MHTKFFLIILWVLFLGVMTGGILYPGLSKRLTKFQSKFYKLGHAHGGVMTLAGLLYLHYIAQTNISSGTKNVAMSLFILGGLGISGGFFWHAFIDKVEEKHSGVILLAAGYISLFLAVLTLLYALWQL